MIVKEVFEWVRTGWLGNRTFSFNVVFFEDAMIHFVRLPSFDLSLGVKRLITAQPSSRMHFRR